MFDGLPQTADQAVDAIGHLLRKKKRGLDTAKQIEATARLRDWLRRQERKAA